jgi:hypothetical protein
VHGGNLGPSLFDNSRKPEVVMKPVQRQSLNRQPERAAPALPKQTPRPNQARRLEDFLVETFGSPNIDLLAGMLLRAGVPYQQDGYYTVQLQGTANLVWHDVIRYASGLGRLHPFLNEVKKDLGKAEKARLAEILNTP